MWALAKMSNDVWPRVHDIIEGHQSFAVRKGRDGKTVNRNIVWNFGNFSTNKGFPLLLGSLKPVSKRDIDSRYGIS